MQDYFLWLKALLTLMDLDVLVSDDLKLGAQCRSAAAKAKWKFGVLKKSFTSRSESMWYKTHIRPIQAWSPHLNEFTARSLSTLTA
jgi:hypothetical protein